MGKNPANDAMITAAALPGPNHNTRRGRNDRSGNAPKSMIIGVRVKSNLFLLPATKARGSATEKARKRPQARFRKLWPNLSKKDSS